MSINIEEIVKMFQEESKILDTLGNPTKKKKDAPKVFKTIPERKVKILNIEGKTLKSAKFINWNVEKKFLILKVGSAIRKFSRSGLFVIDDNVYLAFVVDAKRKYVSFQHLTSLSHYQEKLKSRENNDVLL